MMDLNSIINIVVCQKSKINDWFNHFKNNYQDAAVYDLTNKREYENFIEELDDLSKTKVAVINYDLVWRKNELLTIEGFTLLLDESSMIQHCESKRTKFILHMKPENVILLSGTFTNGRLENLYSQAYLTGYKTSKYQFENKYCIKEKRQLRTAQGIRYFNEIVGYKNEDELFEKLKSLGWIFMKNNGVVELPEKNFFIIKDKNHNKYKEFIKNRYVVVNNKELIGDTATNRFLHQRQLCGMYSKEKLQRVEDILNSTYERIIIFYNFIEELNQLETICKKCNKPISYMNGSNKDLSAYDNYENSVTLIQYQSGSYGLNLQKCNQTIYFTPPLSSEVFEQSKARTLRLGQHKPCFYYQLVIEDSIEEKIYETLDKRQDFTNKLFMESEELWENKS